MINQQTNSQTDLYVSPELYIFEEPLPHRLARDFQWGEIVYRRLDAKYFGWLNRQMRRVANALNKGAVSIADYNETLVRFVSVYEWVLERFGVEKLKRAISRFNDKEYQGPVKYQ